MLLAAATDAEEADADGFVGAFHIGVALGRHRERCGPDGRCGEEAAAGGFGASHSETSWEWELEIMYEIDPGVGQGKKIRHFGMSFCS